MGGLGKRVFVIGTRGFPHVQGGVERHCEELYPRLGARGYSITVFRRRPYVQPAPPDEPFTNVTFVDLWCPRVQGAEALYHSVVAALYAIVRRPALVHVHNIGPGLVVPLLRLFGLRVLVTYHTKNYEHDKWGPLGRALLRLGESVTLNLSHYVIFVSKVVMENMGERAKRPHSYIPNGVAPPALDASDCPLEAYGLREGRYLLAVGRLTREKGFDILLEAFRGVKTDWNLVIVGGADHETDHSRALREAAHRDPRVVMPGPLFGEDLAGLYRHAGCFALPSRAEAMPIALLEAFSYGLPTVMSDLAVSAAVAEGQPFARTFAQGSAADLVAVLEQALSDEAFLASGRNASTFVMQRYNWDSVADETATAYDRVVGVHVTQPAADGRSDGDN